MKKAVSFILALVLCLSMCSCGRDTLSSDVGNIEKPTASQHTHDWKAANCTKPKTCLTCGETEGNTKAHEYKAENTVAANCTSEGYAVYACAYCGDKYTEDLAKTEHNYSDATCSSPMTCKDCGTTSGLKLDHMDNGSGCCKYCSKNMIIAKYEGKLYGKLIISSVGTKNAYFTLQIINQTGHTVYLSSFATGNGKLCYNSGLKGYELPSGYKVNADYYRGYTASDRFNDKYYDMYLDANSWAYTTLEVDGTTIFLKVNAAGETVLGLSLSDIGVA